MAALSATSTLSFLSMGAISIDPGGLGVGCLFITLCERQCV